MQVPPEEYPFYHRLPIQMRFNDLDALGHVNNTVYLEYMDLAKAQYIRQVLDGEFDFEHHSVVIVNINCSFYEITLYDEPLEVMTRVDSIAEHTLTFEQRVANADTGHVKAIARTVMVGFDARAAAKMAIPEAWRQRISAAEHRPL